jgi:hypothetical protein
MVVPQSIFRNFGVVLQLLDRLAWDGTRRFQRQDADREQRDPTASAASPTISVAHTIASAASTNAVTAA